MEILLAVIAIAAIMYKVYLHESIDGEPYAKTHVLTGYISFRHMLPIAKNKYSANKHKVVKRANVSLLIFWLSFLLLIVF